MPQLAATFVRRADEAIALAYAGDIALAAAKPGTSLRKEWYVSRVEYLYEVAYLRLFNEWELFLEESFVRYLCGYVSMHGCPAPVPGGSYFGSIALAERAVLGTRDFVLWHDPITIARRAKKFLVNSKHELVISSNSGRLSDLGAIRHRIAHAQEDARRKFDGATMMLAGRRYRGGRPGRFLRDWDSNAPPVRWLETVALELKGLAGQIG